MLLPSSFDWSILATVEIGTASNEVGVASETSRSAGNGMTRSKSLGFSHED